MTVITAERAFQLIRNDEQLGRDSNSYVDEAMTNAELMYELIDLQEEWGLRFTWSNIRKFYCEIEKRLWDDVGMPWPPRP